MRRRPEADHDSREFSAAPPSINGQEIDGQAIDGQAIDRQSGFVLAVGWLIALLVTLT